jgi:bacillopeptidase F
VVDDDGATASKQVAITVTTPNQAPQILSFTADPKSGNAPLSVTFTCKAVDLDGYITTYKWDFDGDGQIDRTTTTGEITYTYQRAGIYHAICTVVDDDGAQITSQQVTIEVVFPPKSLIFNVEGSGSWEWGVPESGPNFAYTGLSCWGTNLNGNYNNNENGWIVSSSIDLSNTTNPQLVFWHWYQIEPKCDYGYVEISTDGGESWQTLKSYTGSNESWQKEEIDLSKYKVNNIKIRFRFSSDTSGVYAGWYVDKIEILDLSKNAILYQTSSDVNDKEEGIFLDSELRSEEENKGGGCTINPSANFDLWFLIVFLIPTIRKLLVRVK